MKIPILVLLALLCNESSHAQFKADTVAAMAGDTVLALSLYYPDDPYCGKVYGNLYIDGADTSKFTVIEKSIASPFAADIYFTPVTPGVFRQQYGVELIYSNNIDGCPGFYNSNPLFYGIALPDTLSIFFPSQYRFRLYPDFIKRRYADTISFVYRNNTPDTVTVIDIRYEGANTGLVTLSYADGTPLNSPKAILPLTKKQNVYLYFISKEGPYEYDRSAKLIIKKMRNKILLLDTVSMDLSFASIYFEGEIKLDPTLPATTDYTLSFDSHIGDTVYKYLAVTYSNYIEKLDFVSIPFNSGFSISKVTTLQARKLSVEFRFIPMIEGIQGYTYRFKYFIKLFNDSLQEFTYPGNVNLQANVGAKSNVSQVSERNEFSLHPNPAENSLTIQTSMNVSNVQCTIFDQLGRSVLRRQGLDFSGDRKVTLDVSAIPSGMYFLHVEGEGVSKSEAVVISR